MFSQLQPLNDVCAQYVWLVISEALIFELSLKPPNNLKLHPNVATVLYSLRFSLSRPPEIDGFAGPKTLAWEARQGSE